MFQINIDFLQSIGKQIFKVEELKAGDVIGMPCNNGATGQDNAIRLHYVSDVYLNPAPPYLLPPAPYVKLMLPHIGFSINKNKEIYGFHYLAISEQSEQGFHGWSDTTFQQYVDWGLEEEFAKTLSVSDPKFLIDDDNFKKLGEIIPLVVMPSFSFLPQSRFRNIHDLRELAESLQSEFSELRRIQSNITKKCFDYGRPI